VGKSPKIGTRMMLGAATGNKDRVPGPRRKGKEEEDRRNRQQGSYVKVKLMGAMGNKERERERGSKETVSRK